MSLFQSNWVVYSCLFIIICINDLVIVSGEDHVNQVTTESLNARQVVSTQNFLRRAYHAGEFSNISRTYWCLLTRRTLV